MNAYEKLLATAIQFRELPTECINLATDILGSILAYHLGKNNTLQIIERNATENKTSFQLDYGELLRTIEEAGQQGIGLLELSKRFCCPKEFLIQSLSQFPDEITEINEERVIHKKYVQKESHFPTFAGRKRITVEKFLSLIKDSPVHIEDLACKLGVKPPSLRVFFSRHRKKLKNVKFEKSYFMIVNSRNKKTEPIKTKRVLEILSKSGGRISNRDLAFKLGKTNSQLSDWWSSLVRRKAKQLEKIDFDPLQNVFVLKHRE
ncbi:hypothetical protein [Methylacidiphilum caldifontis]|uniref:Uncharacterized protein n=1 Tax=Methylacidiphilum caldifontis TaxID=2795386 RepID=A0A4Y8P938_9BACT|nr:hypothetical protein [Methylacidiphilum caldifontis]TFE67082.1 hypothetical protein A7Q10_09925 [Methylacidiphilum caldifontis]